MLESALRRGSMERWFIVGCMIAICLVLAAAGLHFQRTNHQPVGICASADAHCGEAGL
jgi:hypothetical protein